MNTTEAFINNNVIPYIKMNKLTITKLMKNFEKYAYKEDDIEFWLARDLQNLLGYIEWRKFSGVIDKAKIACNKAGFDIMDHFVQADKMVELGSGAQRGIEDIMLTRYACYLIAQNGDSKKDEISFAQSYFAIQTRKQELIEERIELKERIEARKKLKESETEFSKLIYERGIDHDGFARLRSSGDKALFGGKSTKYMKKKLDVPENRAIADFLPTITISAKNLATEITNFNVKRHNLFGEEKITDEHVKNNEDIRKVLTKNNIVPEDLPAEEDIKKLERKADKNEKELAKKSIRGSIKNK